MMDSSSPNQNAEGSEQLLDPQRPVYVFTQEELKVLRECNRESLLFRSIPIGTLLGSVTYYALYKGMLKPSPRFGSLPKTLGAAFLGYILGKVSYQKTCVDKILQLPNSKLADTIRKNKGLRIPTELLGVEGSGSSAADEVFTKIPQKPIFDDHKPDERDRNEGLEEYQKVTDSLSEYTLPVDGPAGAPVLSYDDRKRLNREEYNARTVERLRRPGGQLADLSSSPLPSPSAPSSSPPLYRSSPSSPPPSVGSRNKYGDIVYEE